MSRVNVLTRNDAQRSMVTGMMQNDPHGGHRALHPQVRHMQRRHLPRNLGYRRSRDSGSAGSGPHRPASAGRRRPGAGARANRAPAPRRAGELPQGARAMTVLPASLAACFDLFGATAFRLETLRAYDVPAEAEILRAYRLGLPLPERSARTSPWLARIAQTTVGGKSWHRARMVGWPLTEY